MTSPAVMARLVAFEGSSAGAVGEGALAREVAHLAAQAGAAAEGPGAARPGDEIVSLDAQKPLKTRLLRFPEVNPVLSSIMI